MPNYAHNIMLRGGWAPPIGADDWHYFKKATLKSLCGRFKIDNTSMVIPGSDGHTLNCQECWTVEMTGD